MQTPSAVIREDGKQQCKNCKCWREQQEFVGARGNPVKNCLRCREKDARQKSKPEIVGKRNALQREKKYYQAHREKKRAENEDEYLKRNAANMQKWRANNAERLREWKNQSVNYNFHAISAQATKKGIPWSPDLTEETFKALMVQPCFYCDRLDNDRVNGVDRMNSMVGYCTQNVVPCCRFCNMMKTCLDALTFVERCNHIAACHADNTLPKYPTAWVAFSRSADALLSVYQYRAQKRNIPFQLSQNEFDRLTKNSYCYYCERTDSLGIDRLSNDEGYSLMNCAGCCSECNYMKGQLTVEEFVAQALRVARHRAVTAVPNMPRSYYSLNRGVKVIYFDNEAESDSDSAEEADASVGKAQAIKL